MPDKKKYVEEMIRVLKPGGTIVIATWCQRETPPEFTPEEEANLKFLYEEWAHPYFVSIEEYVRLMEGTEKMATVGSANWVKETIRSWRHSIWVGVYDPGRWCSRVRASGGRPSARLSPSSACIARSTAIS